MVVIDKKIYDIAQKLGEALLREQLTVTAAESCTGGGVAQAITSIAGSSQWFNGSIVSYSNECKQSLLSVDPAIISREGAVSKAVVCAMAVGVQAQLKSDIAIAVSGIAGPDGGTDSKPVGTVWIAWVVQAKEAEATKFDFNGDRISIRKQAVYKSLLGALSRLMP